MYMTLECRIRAESNINDCDALLSRNLLSDSFLCVFRLRVSYLRVFLLFISRLYRVLVVDVCTVAWCYVVMSRNLSGFVHKLSHVDQFLCPHFKKQRRRFLPEELRTVKLNIFLHCEFICQCSLEFRRVWSERSDSRIHSVLLPVDSYGVFHRHDNSQDHVKG